MTNLEAKQEAIKNAYGEHWEYLKNFINEDGVFIGDTDMISDKLFGEWAFIGSAKDINSEKLISGSRPKSLQGIENNNGWIKIENEDDLPKNDMYVHIIFNKKANIAFLCNGEFYNLNKVKYYKEGVTHYQPIEKPKLPIY